jgi:hypothetical protein
LLHELQLNCYFGNPLKSGNPVCNFWYWLVHRAKLETQVCIMQLCIVYWVNVIEMSVAQGSSALDRRFCFYQLSIEIHWKSMGLYVCCDYILASCS